MRTALIASLLTTSLLTAQQEEEQPAIENQVWNRVKQPELLAKYQARGRGHKQNPCEKHAIQAGLEWLKNNQNADGSWRYDGAPDLTTAVTSLSVLAMLGDASTLRSGPYKTQLKKAVAWLRDNQQASGAFADSTGPHLLATLAMVESYYLTTTYKLIKKSTVAGLTHAASLRCSDGGWGGRPGDELSDPSLTLWGTNMLMAAADADLIAKPSACAGVLDWLSGERASLAPGNGILGFPASPMRQADLTYDQAAANAFTLCFLADKLDGTPRPECLEVMRKDALSRGAALPRTWVQNPRLKLSIYEWFCTTHALAQAGNHKAVAAINTSLAKYQVREGEHLGSWEPIGAWGELGGRAWTTAMAVLTLESPFRFLKIEGL